MNLGGLFATVLALGLGGCTWGWGTLGDAGTATVDGGSTDGGSTDGGSTDSGVDGGAERFMCTEPSGSGTVTPDATSCGALRSAFWIRDSPVAFSEVIATGGVSCCSEYASLRDEPAFLMFEYESRRMIAEMRGDFRGMCEALREFLDDAEAVSLTLHPPGSCTLSLVLDALDDGTYGVGPSWMGPLNLSGSLAVATPVDVTSERNLLGDCSMYTSLDELLMREPAVRDGAMRALEGSEMWFIEEGTVTVSSAGASVTGTITLTDAMVTLRQTIALDLSPHVCSPPPR